MTKITIICSHCKKDFEKKLKYYNQHKSKGRNDFYCSRRCWWDSRIDELSPFRVILRSLKKNSWIRGKEMRLNLEFLKSLWEKQNGICPYTGLKMVLSGQEKHTPYSASLDRIDSSKGYIKGNVEFVCLFVNYGKNGFRQEQVKQFIADVLVNSKVS